MLGLGKIFAALGAAACVTFGIGAWSTAASSVAKPWRPPATVADAAMPAERLPLPPTKAKLLPLVGQSTPKADKTKVATR